MGLIYYSVASPQPQPSEVKKLTADSEQIIGSALERGAVTYSLARDRDGCLRQGYFVPDDGLERQVASIPYCSWKVRRAAPPPPVARLAGLRSAIAVPSSNAPFATYMRACGFTATGGTRRHDEDIRIFAPGRIDLSKLELPSLVSQSGPLNLLSAIFTIAKDEALPANDVARMRPLGVRADAHWMAVASALCCDSIVAVYARPFRVPEKLRAYIRAVSRLLETYMPGGYRQTAVFDAILDGEPLLQVTPVAFSPKGLSAVSSAFDSDLGPGKLESVPGTFYRRLTELAPEDQHLLFPLGLLYTREEAISLLHFAYSTEAVDGLEQVGVSPFGRPQVVVDNGVRILIGDLVRGGRPYWEPLRLFRSHCAIFGRPNAGKTVALAWLTSQLIQVGCGILALDVVKGETAQFIGSMGGNVYDLAGNPPPVNLFIPEENEFVDQRINLLVPMFTAFHAANKVGANEWRGLLSHVYGRVAAQALGRRVSEDELRSLTGRDLISNQAMIPTVEHLVAIGREYVESMANSPARLDQDRRAYFKAALDDIRRSRLALLLRGPARAESFYDETAAALTLENLTDVDLKRAALIGLTMGLRARRREQRQAGVRIDHFTLIDEAHFIAPASPRGEGGSEIISSAKELAALFAEALKELRGYGESLVLADQSPSELDAVVLRTCNAIICFAIQEGEDRARMRDTLGLSGDQPAYLSTLEQGTAVVSLEGRTPYEVRFRMHPRFPK